MAGAMAAAAHGAHAAVNGMTSNYLPDVSWLTETSTDTANYAWLEVATPNALGDNAPGRLFVGSTESSVQWAGQHCDLNMDSR